MKFGKFLVILSVAMFFLSGNCSAMEFSQPVEIGRITAPPIGGFYIEKATYNDGNVLNSKINEYGKGTAHFGNGNDILYFYYDSYLRYPEPRCKFGLKDTKNTVVLELGETSSTIQKINSNNGVVLYVFTIYEGDIRGMNFIVLGKQMDGKFVKFIDFKQIIMNQFGEGNKYRYFPTYTSKDDKGIYFGKDSIVIKYSTYSRELKQELRIGEFRFKWDDAAQWFSVEQIKY